MNQLLNTVSQKITSYGSIFQPERPVEDRQKMQSGRVEESPPREMGAVEALQKKKDISFRVGWSQAILFGCYEVTVSFVLVIVSISYYQKPSDGSISSCGDLFPTWRSVAAIISIYALVYLIMVATNVFFIRQTSRKMSSNVSRWIILTHPAGRLILGLLGFFITCAFSVTEDKTQFTQVMYVNRIARILTKTCMVVDAGFCIFFLAAVIKREVDWLSAGTSIWTVRQLVFLQLKFAVIVCYLQRHINVVVLVLIIFICNALVYIIWSRMAKNSRKAKEKYSVASLHQDENENTTAAQK